MATERRDSLGPWSFGRLVRRLRYRQYRTDSTLQKLNIAFGVLLTGLLTVGSIAAVVALRPVDDGSLFVSIGLTIGVLLWMLLPIPFAAGNSAVDPQLYSMYPISQRAMGLGLLSAAFISFPAIGSGLVLVSTLSHARSVLGGVIILITAVVMLVSVVLSSQTVMFFFAGSLQRRSTRDFAAGLGALVALSLAMLPQMLSEVFATAERQDRAVEFLRDAADWQVWLPWGWGPSMFLAGAENQWGRAAYFGLLALAWIIVVFSLWSYALHRSLVDRPAKADTHDTGALVAPWQQRLLGSQLGAVTARSLKELRRDPRQLMEIAAWLPLVLVSAVPAWEAVKSGADELVLSAALGGVAVGLSSFNVFGFEGRDFGTDVLVDRHLGVALQGKLMARLLLGVVSTVVIALVFAVITGGWRYVASSVALGATGLLATLAIGAYVSVWYPYPAPPKAGVESMMYNPGCLLQVIRGLGLFAVLMVVGPAVGAVVALSLSQGAPLGFGLSVVFVAVAIVVYRLAVKQASNRLIATAPEMFQVLSTPTTARS